MKFKTLPIRMAAILAVIVIFFSALSISPAYADSAGPRHAGLGESIGLGTALWVNPNNIVSPPGAPYANAAVPDGGSTNYLQATHYGFTIPSGSRIDRITVAINRRSSAPTIGEPLIRDQVVQLVKGGVPGGTNKAVTGSDWPTSYGVATYGGIADPDPLWGSTWTAGEINAADFGVVLAAMDPADILFGHTAFVDYIQVMVTYTPGTTTSVNCGGGTPVVTFGSTITCIATVTRLAGGNTPTGNVAWITSGAGTFTTSPCTLAPGIPGTASCSVVYTPTAVGSGAHTITATYSGDVNFVDSFGAQIITVNKATPTLSVTNSPVVYNGTPQAATIAYSVPGALSDVKYSGSTTIPTNAANYLMTADFVPTDTANYNSLNDALAGNFVIQKATPTLSVTNSPQVYNGTPWTAVVEASLAGSPVPGTFSDVRYNGSPTAPTNADTYVVTADFTPTDTINYNNLNDATAGNFVIQKATPTLSVTNSPVVYNGTPRAATIASSVPGTPPSNIRYNGSATVPTNAGTYAVTADFVPTDAINYETLADGLAGNFVIQKATPSLAVTNSPVTYNGSPWTAIIEAKLGVTVVPGAPSNIRYNGSLTTPTNAGSYAVVADFTPTDTLNYNSLVGTSAGNFVIQKATPTCSVTNSPVVYNGAPRSAAIACSVSGSPSDIKYNGSTTAPTNAGTYAVTVDFAPTDATNYNSLNDAPAGNFVIQKATPTIAVTYGTAVYNGLPQEATIVSSVPGVISNIRYNGSTTPPTNVGIYAVVANFAPTDAANYINLVDEPAGDFIIEKAIPTCVVTNSPVVYNGTPRAATVVCSVAGNPVPGTFSNVRYNSSPTAPTNAGTYAVTANFTPTDATNYETLVDEPAGNFIILKATPTLSVTNSPVVYNGTPQAATVVGSVPGIPTNCKYNGSPIVPTNASTYAVTCDFTPTDTTNYNSLVDASAGNFVILKVTPSLSVTNSPQVYNSTPWSAVIEASLGGNPVPGTFSDVRYNGSPTAPTNAGTYAVTADFAPTDSTNYNNLNDALAGNFVIEKATPTLSVTNSPVVYNGTPQAATIVPSVPGAVSNVRYNGSASAPANAGTYAVTADFVPTDTANYNSLTDESAGDFVIEKATPTCAVTNSGVIYNGTPRTATVSCSVPGVVSNIRYNGSATAPTNAGTYVVTVDFVPTDTANYNSLTDAPAGNFIIQKATPTCSVTSGPVIYTGTPQAAAIVPSVPGIVSNIRYNSSATVPTNAGTYAVTADFAPTDATNYNNLVGAPCGNFVILKATPTIAVTYGTAVYTGLPQIATIVPSVPGTVSNIRYNGSTTAPTEIGIYAVVADFTPDDATNYNSLTDEPAGNFIIEPANPTLSVTNSPVVYTGSPQAATIASSVPGTLSNVRYNGSTTVPANAGTYAVTANFTPTDTTHYNSLVNASAGDFVIQKVAPSLSVTNSPVVYNGSPRAATVVGSVPGTVSNIKYNGSATVPTNAGTYVMTADFVPTNTTSYNSLVDAPAGNFVILKATPTLSVTNSPVVYNGSPQAATVASSVPGTISNIKYNGSVTVPTNSGNYAVTADFTPTDAANYNSLVNGSAGNFVIQFRIYLPIIRK